MEQVFIYGKEHTFLEEDTGLLFRNSTETASCLPSIAANYKMYLR